MAETSSEQLFVTFPVSVNAFVEQQGLHDMSDGDVVVLFTRAFQEYRRCLDVEFGYRMDALHHPDFRPGVMPDEPLPVLNITVENITVDLRRSA
jgi:hypothetical protein